MLLKDYPVNRVISSGESLRNSDIGVRRPDRAEPVWLLCNAYPIRDEGGKLFRVVVTFIDVTPQLTRMQTIRSTGRYCTKPLNI
jgi:PAS domain-containing protein